MIFRDVDHDPLKVKPVRVQLFSIEVDDGDIYCWKIFLLYYHYTFVNISEVFELFLPLSRYLIIVLCVSLLITLTQILQLA